MINEKEAKRRKAVRLLVSAVLIFFLCLIPADATSDTKEKMEQAEQKKEEKEEELAQAQKDLAQTEEKLAGLQAVKNDYQGEMNVLNEEMQLVADHLAVIETKIELKQMEIDETRAALEEATRRRINQYESMKARIRFLYEGGATNMLELMFNAENFADFLNYAEYMDELMAYDRLMLDEYKQTEEEITEAGIALEAEMAELDELKQDVFRQQDRVNELMGQTAVRIAKTEDSIDEMNAQADAFEQDVNEKVQEVADATEEYQKIKAKYEEELRLSRLAAQSTWRDISEVTFEENDRYLLANLIYCEAGGEPYEGQVAVGAVVINRVLSSRYPDTVTGVIYQRGQFSPVDYGTLANALNVNKATDSCYRAADEAMAGKTNVGNCVYFRTPIPGLEGIRIGGHIFY